MRRPENSEYSLFYEGYVSSITETDVLSVLAAQPDELRSLITGVAEDRGSFAYAAGKWTIKELLGHIIDGERVFGYRAHRISHGDQTPLPGFDQEIYVRNGRSGARTFADMLDEFADQRKANLAMARHFSEGDLDRTGIASDASVTVRALLFIMAGHVRHHQRILAERYLSE